MATTVAEDNMSDDVFMGSDDEKSDLEVPQQIAPHPSPTGYRDYKPPVHLLKKPQEYEILHKVRTDTTKSYLTDKNDQARL